MTPPPKISVVMGVYNSAAYLRQALASIRWQTFADWECICVNDGSTDASRAILADFAAADPRFRILDQTNQGVVAALNRGDREARAAWIARMDSDDIALPQRLEQQWQFVQLHHNIVAVGGNATIVDPDGAPISNTQHVLDHATITARLHSGAGGVFAHPTLLMSREAVLQAGQYRQEHYWAHDSDLLMRLARVGHLANLPDIVLHYRQHPSSFCATKRQQIRDHQATLLREMQAAGTADSPSATPRKRRTVWKSSLAAKWARQSARAGNYRTALKHWRKQISAEPLSVLSARTSAELMLRLAESLFRRRPPAAELPDWRPWDCPAPARGPSDLAA